MKEPVLQYRTVTNCLKDLQQPTYPAAALHYVNGKVRGSQCNAAARQQAFITLHRRTSSAAASAAQLFVIDQESS